MNLLDQKHHYHSLILEESKLEKEKLDLLQKGHFHRASIILQQQREILKKVKTIRDKITDHFHSIEINKVNLELLDKINLNLN